MIPDFINSERGSCFFYQETRAACIPASIQMILKTYDVTPLPSQEELAIEMKTDVNHRTYWENIRFPFEKRGYNKYQSESLSTEPDQALLYLKKSVSKNFPTIIITWYDRIEKEKFGFTHGLLIIGYNKTGMFFHDPLEGPLRYLDNKTFSDLWNVNGGYWAFIVEKETSQPKGESITMLLLGNLGIMSLIVVGFISEMDIVSRLAPLINSMALTLFFIRLHFIPWYIMLYLLVGTLLGLIGLKAYIRDDSLSDIYYATSLIPYSSVTAIAVISTGLIRAV